MAVGAMVARTQASKPSLKAQDRRWAWKVDGAGWQRSQAEGKFV